MNGFTVLASVLFLAVAVLIVTPSAGAFTNDALSLLEDKSVQIFTDVVSGSGIDETRAVTPYGYKAVMLQNVPGRKVLCWRCSSPCSAYMCCDDGYPQCCLVSGRCMCCRV